MHAQTIRQTLFGMILVTATVAVGLGLGAWMAFTMGIEDSGEVSQGHASWAFDVSNDRKLVGWADTVFFARVREKLGQTRVLRDPESQFRVQVLEVLKGSLPGTVTVSQEAGYEDGRLQLMEGDSGLLEPGKSYLFISRTSDRGWHTIVPGYGTIAP